MKTILILILSIAAVCESCADETKSSPESHDKDLVIEVMINDPSLCRLLEKVWSEVISDNKVITGKEEFLVHLSGFLPAKGEKIEILGDKLLISGHRPFVSVTSYLMANIMLNPSLKAEDFKVLQYPAGSEKGLIDYNNLRKRLRLDPAID